MTRPPFEPPSERDLDIVAVQLGRRPRDVVGIAARCSCGAPVVLATKPRLGDGTPFPTFYYLSHPAATAALSHLEAAHLMVEMNEQLEADPELADAYEAAHRSYLADRAQFGEVAEIAEYSAGGMPERVKCLHALAAHALAAGPGVNPLGDAALAACSWSPSRCVCPDYDALIAERAAELPEASGRSPRQTRPEPHAPHA